jgi:hypothetical protein
MKCASILLCAACAGACTLAVSRSARALGPVDIEIASRVGGGTSPIKDDPINILGFGLGGRAGASILGIYGGVSGAYYFGGGLSPGTPLSNGGISRKTTVSSWLYGIQGGYSFSILALTLRPSVEVGNYVIHATLAGFPTENFSNVYIEPGVTALVGIGMWFLGADANVFLTPGLDGSQAAFVGDGQVGIKF